MLYSELMFLEAYFVSNTCNYFLLNNVTTVTLILSVQLTPPAIHAFLKQKLLVVLEFVTSLIINICTVLCSVHVFLCLGGRSHEAYSSRVVIQSFIHSVSLSQRFLVAR